MKLSELTPCIVCGGPLGAVFYRVKTEQVLVDATAANQVIGLNTMFGGRLRLAETFAPRDDITTTLQTGDGLVCPDCFYSSDATRKTMFNE